MAYPINGGAILEIQIVGRLHGQTTRSVFHYLKDGHGGDFTDGALAAQLALDTFTASVGNAVAANTSNEWTLQYLSAQWVSPTRFRQVLTVAADSPFQGGQIVQNSLPSGAAMVVSTYSERAGRHFRGRKYFPGIPSQAETDSRLTVGQTTNLQTDVCPAMVANITVQTVALKPCLCRTVGSLQDSQVINLAIARDIIRYQRRREIGVGE